MPSEGSSDGIFYLIGNCFLWDKDPSGRGCECPRRKAALVSFLRRESVPEAHFSCHRKDFAALKHINFL